jgi:CRISPR/Cas system-associated exonuclease Cas4 (RecB family)
MFRTNDDQRMNLTYSQASLQDFVDCRRRFQLRYLRRLAWPAMESEPALENERLMQLGAQCHRMIQQYLIGIDPDRLKDMIHDPDLSRWWDHFEGSLESGNLTLLKDHTVHLYPEISLVAPLAGARLSAKCDLVSVSEDGRVVIYDWKTSRKRPERSRLAARLQTRVYPYLLARAGAYLYQGMPINPQAIEMVYWFVDFPDQAELFTYDLEQHLADEQYLSGLIEEIAALEENNFPMTTQIERCRFCVYRSFCERGVEAGSTHDSEVDPNVYERGDIMVDFDQIGEIAF